MSNDLNDQKLLTLEVNAAETIKQQYLGILGDTETGKVEWRRIPIYKELLPYIFTLLNDERTEYHKLEEFMIHAVHLLLQAYIEAGYFDPDMKAALSFQKMLRQKAAHEKQKAELMEGMHSFDNTLDQAVINGWEQAERITAYLSFLEQLIRNEETETGKQEIRSAIAQSQSLYRAVKALNRWCEVEDRYDETVVAQAERWREGLELWSHSNLDRS